MPQHPDAEHDHDHASHDHDDHEEVGTGHLAPLRRFAARDFAGWSGLVPHTTVADIAAAFEVDDTPQPATLGSEHRAAGWATVAAGGYPDGIRIWFDGIEVALLDGPDPELPGSLETLLGELGEPEARLDAYFGTLLLKGSEWVYPARGLTVYVNPANMLLLRLVAYAPASLDTYERHLRLDLQVTHLPRRER